MDQFLRQGNPKEQKDNKNELIQEDETLLLILDMQENINFQY